MRAKALVTLSVLAGIGGFASAARAAPIAPAPADVVGAGSDITAVKFGCGYGWAPNAWGRCRPVPGYAYGARPFYRPGCFVRYTPWGPRRFCRY